MSNTVDNRVVEMQFDNAHFERNVSNSLSTLEKLKQSLNLTGAAKGLESVDAAARGISLSGLTSAAETVGLKFNAMYTIADQTLRNIVNSAYRAGENMVKALTIDPIKTGFSEYETQIGAVQTILANTSSKGKTLDDVNFALDQLNTYADKTIYNFTEMTRNIGTFTAAGVDLDKSVTSIKGIANLAAVSGSTSQQASTAMYQLSQALAAGKVQLMDWNSVVNAGMGGQVFQDALKRTAKNMGTNVDAMIKKYGSFRESLTKGEWLTAEVLTETLTQLSGAYTEADLLAQGYTKSQAAEILELAETAVNAATKVKTFTQLWDTLKESAQSGWTQTWEILIGDFEEAKALFTEVSDRIGGMIGASAESRNALLSEAFGEHNPIPHLVELTGVTEENITKLYELGQKSGYASDEFKELAASLFNGDKALENNIGKMMELGISEKSVVGYLTELTGASAKSVLELVNLGEKSGYTSDEFKTLALELAKGDAVMQETIISIFQMSKEMSKLTGRELVIDSIRNAFNGILQIITPVKEAFREVFPPITSEQLYSFLEGLHELTTKFTLTEEQSAYLKNAFKGLFSIVDIGLEAVKAVARGLFSLTQNFSGIGTKILETADSWGTWVYELRNTIKETDFFGDIVNKIAGYIKNVINVLKNFASTIKGSFQTPEAKNFLGTMTNIWEFVKLIGSKVGEAFAAIGGGVANAFGESGFMDILNSGLFAGILVGIGKFTKTLEGLFDNVGGVLENVTGILDDVRGCFQAYQDQLKAGTLLKIAGAIGILAAAIFVISTIDSDSLANALGAITVLFTELIGSLTLLSKVGAGMKGVTKAVGMMAGVSVAVLILASALKVISTVGPEGIAKGLLTIAILMAELSIFLATVKFDSKLVGTAAGIVILALGLRVLADAVADFGALSWEELGKGLASIAALLLAIAGFTKLTGDAKHVTSTGIAMVLLGASMKIFASAVQDFSTMSWEEIGRGLTGMAGALAAVTIAMRLLPKNMVTMGVGLIAVGAAMKILASALSDFGGMTGDEIGRSLVVMGLALTELAIALNVMNGTLAGSAALIIAAGALAIMAPVMQILGQMSWEAIVKGLVTLAGAFTIIGLAGLILAPLVPSILGLAGAFALIGLAVLGVGAGLTLAALGLSGLATGVTMLATALVGGATAIVAGLTVIITGVANLIPYVCTMIAVGIVAFAGAIAQGVPALCDAAGIILTALIDLIIKYVPKIADAGLQLIIGLLEAIANNIGKLVKVGIDVVVKFIDGVAQSIPKVVEAGANLIIDFINAMANGIRDNTEDMIDAVDNLMDAIAEAIGKWIVEAFTMGVDFIGGFINGILDAANDAVEAAKGVVSDALEAAKNLLGIKSPSRKFMEVGRYSDEGLAIGLSKYSGLVTDSAKDVGGQAIKALSRSVANIAEIVSGEVDTDLTIRPVLDLTNVEHGAKTINGMFDSTAHMSVLTNVSGIASSMNRRVQNGTNDDVVSAINKLNKSLSNVGNTTYQVNGVTYDDGSNISDAVRTLVRAAKIERRV